MAGIDFRTQKENYPDYTIRLDIWDTAGQEKFRTINKGYYKGAMGAFIVFDLTSMESFEGVQYFLRETKLHADKSEKEKFLRVIFGNKLDLVRQDPNSRQVSESDIQEKLKEINEENTENPLVYYEGSALDGSNVKEAFEVFMKYLREKYATESNKKGEDETGASFKLDGKKAENGKKDPKKGGCC